MKAAYEPTDEECEWKADEEQELTVSNQVQVTHLIKCILPTQHIQTLKIYCALK